MRKIPLPEPRRILSGFSGSGIFVSSNPGPWSAMRMISESVVVSNDAVTCFVESYAFPCSTAFTAASRTAIEIFDMASSSNPARCAHCSATCSILFTLSRDESNVKLTRLVVESAKFIPEYLCASRQRQTTAMMAVCLWISRMSRQPPPFPRKTRPRAGQSTLNAPPCKVSSEGNRGSI
jgi:hypothetical protein